MQRGGIGQHWEARHGEAEAEAVLQDQAAKGGRPTSQGYLFVLFLSFSGQLKIRS